MDAKMVIYYYGLGFVKVQSGDTAVAFNPHAKAVKFGADIALVSLDNDDYNAVPVVTRGDRVPFVIDGPGEYEIGGVFVRGFAGRGSDDAINTIYAVVLDGVRLVHLGALVVSNGAGLPADTTERLGVVDVLFLPIGGGGTIDYVRAAKLMAELGPKVVVPVEYRGPEEVKRFLKEAGAEGTAAVESLSLKKKDLADKEAEVVYVAS